MMRSFHELDSIYNDLSWLEDADIEDFTNQPKAMKLQAEVSHIFEKMNSLVRYKRASEEDGSDSHLLLDRAVAQLEALDKLYKGVRL